MQQLIKIKLAFCVIMPQVGGEKSMVGYWGY